VAGDKTRWLETRRGGWRQDAAAAARRRADGVWLHVTEREWDLDAFDSATNNDGDDVPPRGA
jgi:hypothetical protein